MSNLLFVLDPVGGPKQSCLTGEKSVLLDSGLTQGLHEDSWKVLTRDEGNVYFDEWKYNLRIVELISAKLDSLDIPWEMTIEMTDGVGAGLRDRCKRVSCLLEENFRVVLLSINGGYYQPWSTARGVEVRYPAAGMKDPRYVCEVKSEASRLLAEIIYGKTCRRTGWKQRGVKDTSKKSDYLLEKTPQGCVAVSTYNGFYTSRPELIDMMEPACWHRVADAHAAACEEFTYMEHVWGEVFSRVAA